MATNIGSQDGITAMHNVYRDAWPDKTLLKKGTDGKWPDISTLTQPLDQWKAIDKHQRAEQILVDDHDASLSNGGITPPPIEITRDLSLVQNVLILADDPWPALNSPHKYKIWITADMGYRHIYADGSFIQAAKNQGRQVWSWCDCKAVLGTGTDPEVAIQMAKDYNLNGAAGEGEHSLAFESGYNAGMREFVVNMSALTQAQIDLINEDGKTVLTAELYWNLQPDKPVDWKNCVGVGSNCGAVYQTSSEQTHPITQDDYAANPACVYPTMSWYCGGKPNPDYARLP
jgi:hypothetical protein